MPPSATSNGRDEAAHRDTASDTAGANSTSILPRNRSVRCRLSGLVHRTPPPTRSCELSHHACQSLASRRGKLNGNEGSYLLHGRLLVP